MSQLAECFLTMHEALGSVSSTWLPTPEVQLHRHLYIVSLRSANTVEDHTSYR